MHTSPQTAAPSFGALFVVRLLRGLATLLGFPIFEPIPVRVRRRPHARRFLSVVGVPLLLSCWVTVGWAQELRLTDDTTINAEVLQADDEHVILRIPRAMVASIDGHAPPPAMVAGVAAPEFSVSDLLGHPQAMGKETGKVTLLHFWVSWCPHCRSDAAKIQALYDQYRENPKVQVLTVNLEQDRTQLDPFMKEHNITYPVIFARDVAGMDLPQLYQVNAFPVTFVIGEDGVIRGKVMGSFVESGKDITAMVNELLPHQPQQASAEPAHGAELALANAHAAFNRGAGHE